MREISHHLEKGAGAQAGICGSLIQTYHSVSLALFLSRERHPDNLFKSFFPDLDAHARSAGAQVAVFLTADRQIVWRPGSDQEISSFQNPSLVDSVNMAGKLILSPPPHGVLSHYPVRDELISWLVSARQVLSRWLFRQGGEIVGTVRDLTLLLMINRLILHRIAYSHDISPPATGIQTLFDAISEYVSSSPITELYDYHPVDLNQSDVSDLIAELSHRSAPEIEKIRLSWISPDIWAESFSRLIGMTRDKKKRKHEVFESLPCTPPGRMIRHVHEEHIAELFGEISRTDSEWMITDPACCSGERLAYLFRLMTLTHRETAPDTILSRLIRASEKMYAFDMSPVRIAAVRLVVMIAIIRGEYRDAVLSGPPVWNPFQALSTHIRPGSPLFRSDLVDEFVSAYDAYPVLRRLHPLDPAALPPDHCCNLILIGPGMPVVSGYPEITQYLKQQFQSYEPGINSGALVIEQMKRLYPHNGVIIGTLPASWLSGDEFESFRCWLKSSLPAVLLISDDESDRIQTRGLVTIIIRPGEEDTLTVIRFNNNQEAGGTCQYDLQGRELPDTDGWRLDDPWEEEMISLICTGTMTLRSYLLDEIYLPSDAGTRDTNIWTSISLQEGLLTIHIGPSVDRTAIIAIPESDPFLTILLNSSLIQWYWRATTRGMTLGTEDCEAFIRSIPVKPPDPYDPDEQKMIVDLHRLLARADMLIKLRASSRTGHDRDRINRQISSVRSESDMIIGRLYGITPDDLLKICTRVRGENLAVSTKTLQN